MDEYKMNSKNKYAAYGAILVILFSLTIWVLPVKYIYEVKQFLIGGDVANWMGKEISIPKGFVSRSTSHDKISFFLLEEKSSNKNRRSIAWLEKDKTGEALDKIRSLCVSYDCNTMQYYQEKEAHCVSIEKIYGVDFEKMTACHTAYSSISFVTILTDIKYQDSFEVLRSLVVDQIQRKKIK
ncbi:hypothetical protein [Oceanicoccus sagamiensis]|uniref:Uncharacterized protein n=1 Tax=Oceanicoccus sagamiensis TaxID=716816 RepID=A0A1X9NAX7_9GAMM|nr:hypothetical protein [Oceanicoccus sagamiensis]ARN75200.1 hypothetical protein BST96_14395 [Oceanicoccus sagamiensis]